MFWKDRQQRYVAVSSSAASSISIITDIAGRVTVMYTNDSLASRPGQNNTSMVLEVTS